MQGMDNSLYYNADAYVIIATCVDNNHSSDEARIAFAWYQLVVVFLLPAVTMAYCYTFVIKVLWLSTKRLATLIQAERCVNTSPEPGLSACICIFPATDKPTRKRLRRRTSFIGDI